MTKGERLYKDMKTLGEIETKISWEVGFGHGHGQRGSNIEEWRRIKILGQEKCNRTVQFIRAQVQ